MSLTRALAIASLLVLPGTLLRAGPHAQRFVGGGSTPTSSISSSGPAAADELSGHAGRRLSQRPSWVLALGFAVEVSLHVGLLTIVLGSPALLAMFSALPRTGQGAMVLFFTTVMTGFLAGHDASFPFVSWRMYSGQFSTDPTVCVIEGESQSGAVTRLNLTELLPAIGPRRLHHIVRNQAATLVAGGGAGEDHDRVRLERTLGAVAALYNSRGSGDVLVRLRLSMATISLSSTEPPWLRQPLEVMTIEVEPRP